MASATSLRDSVYEYIQKKLLSGELKAGSQIAEQTLATDIGVSRTPVREAIKQLEREGVIESVPRFGTIIRTPSPKEITELYELRLSLEAYAASKAARADSLTALPHLEQLNRGIHQLGKDLKRRKLKFCTAAMFERYLALDMAFHMMLIQSIDNQRIERLVQESRIFTRIFCSRRNDECGLDSIAVAYRAHARVLRAIRNHDPDEARHAMSDHIEYSRDRSLDYYKQKYGNQDTPFEALAMPKDLLRHLKNMT